MEAVCIIGASNDGYGVPSDGILGIYSEVQKLVSN